MDISGGWMIPEVSNELDEGNSSSTCTVYDVMGWDGRDKDLALALALLS